MSRAQLRQYRVKAGQMDEFVALWRDHVVPARAGHGFRVLAAWRADDDAGFGWLVAHDDDFAEAEQTYYASPERAAIPKDPGSFLDGVETAMVEVVSDW